MRAENYPKMKIALRYYLLGKGFYVALRTMEFASEHHTGMRKDGITPEFAHQVWIANYIRTLEGSITDLETTIATTFLHDCAEDHSVTFTELTNLFGEKISTATRHMTKEYNGIRLSEKHYMQNVVSCSVASIVKGADRLHNVNSMANAFTISKMREYIIETDEHILPMLKKARRQFPSQEAAYQNIRQSIIGRITLIEEIIKLRS